MNAKFIRAFVALTALAGACAATGCVSDRPSRNGVFNENQYVKKSFLVRPGDGSKPDTGWFMKSTIVAASTPNSLAGINLFQGSESSSYSLGGTFVRFDITSDKLRMVNMREISDDPVVADQGTRTGEVVNAWPITNVDLKYRINLDGEKTNFYEENQELDWQVRQWIKINFAKNDLSDLAPYGSYVNLMLQKCADTIDASATLVPNSLLVDEQNSYMQWEVSVTLPLSYAARSGDSAASTTAAGSDPTDADTCRAAMGQVGVLADRMGRDNVTLQVMYSLVRPEMVTDGTYQPLALDEKDPIRKKYGAFEIRPVYRDTNSGLLGAQQLVGRHNPDKDIVYYFAKGMPEPYRKFFADPGGVINQTNAILAKAGAKGKVIFLNYNDDKVYLDGAGPERRYGDVRYSFFNWHSDLDSGPDGLGGIAQFFFNPRTGESISTSVNVWEYAVKDYVLARLDFYLQTVGAETLTPSGDFDDANFPPPAGCKDGDTIPLVPATVAKSHNGTSTVYAKMQQYLQKPVADFGNLGPRDFIVPQDNDFYNAFFALVPYHVYGDPDANYFVTPEGGTGVYSAASQWQGLQRVVQFNKLAGLINRGSAPFDADVDHGGFQNVLAFTKQFRELSLAVNDYQNMKMYNHGTAQFDDISMISYLDVFSKNARHCVNGAWESRADYTKNLIISLYDNTVLHEFGHTLGLRHNFMGSVDQRNFPTYMDGAGRQHIGLYSSSIMEYGVSASDAFFRGANGTGPGWAPHDIASIGWIYANNKKNGDSAKTLSGQSSPTAPWNDPYGFQADGKTEITYLFCTDDHIRYTPMCRQGDLGTTPAEITAAALDQYEWQYKWSNFRLYRKFWTEEYYAQNVASFFNDMRRFFSQWAYDWSPGEIADTLRRVGFQIPAGAPAQSYYAQLTNKFNTDISMASQMIGAFHQAIIQQTSGERPYRSIYDNFFGDVTQQGIIVDKLQALVNWTSLYETTNFDPDQAQGVYLTAFGSAFGDSAFQTIAEGAVESMVGGQYDIFPFYRPTAVAQFAASTHDINYRGRIELRDWVGGKVFFRERDFLDFVHSLAAQYPLTPGYQQYNCTSIDSWDPRTYRVVGNDLSHSDTLNTFQGPDGRTYIWAYIADRNEWVLVDRDRNTAAYVIMVNWTNAVINGEADGSGANGFDPYGLLLPMKYFLDSFNTYN